MPSDFAHAGSVCMGIAVALQSMFVSIDWPISPEAIIAVLYAGMNIGRFKTLAMCNVL